MFKKINKYLQDKMIINKRTINYNILQVNVGFPTENRWHNNATTFTIITNNNLN